jgi:hypothetical protein
MTRVINPSNMPLFFKFICPKGLSPPWEMQNMGQITVKQKSLNILAAASPARYS